MPRWYQHARQLAGLQRRWTLNRSLGEILSGVVPVVEVDKHRSADDSNIYGMLVQAAGNLGQIEACALVAQDNEVLIHKIEFWWTTVFSLVSRPVHIFTPLQTYTPFDVASNAYFSWWQGPANVGDEGKLGRTFGAGGLGSAHQVVNVNGVPITTFGPSFDYEVMGLGAVDVAMRRPAVKIWDFQDPPFRLKPGVMACVQSVSPAIGAGDTLNVNFYYSEREPQGDFG